MIVKECGCVEDQGYFSSCYRHGPDWQERRPPWGVLAFWATSITVGTIAWWGIYHMAQTNSGDWLGFSLLIFIAGHATAFFILSTFAVLILLLDYFWLSKP